MPKLNIQKVIKSNIGTTRGINNLALSGLRGSELIFTFTVNEKADMQKVIEIGVDGIITDSPDILKNIMK